MLGDHCRVVPARRLQQNLVVRHECVTWERELAIQDQERRFAHAVEFQFRKQIRARRKETNCETL